LVEFVPYDEKIHRAQFFELNVKYVTWIFEEMRVRQNIDVIPSIEQTIREYVEVSLEDLTTVRPPKGIIYVLEDEGKMVGMGALKELEVGIGEIKRMYICPRYRGKGLGKEMFEKLIERGKEFGFSTLRLETADFMTQAHKVYRSAGFKEIGGYSGGEMPEWYRPNCIFMEKSM